MLIPKGCRYLCTYVGKLNYLPHELMSTRWWGWTCVCPSQLLCKAQSGGVIGKGGMSSLWSVLYLLLSLNCERMAKVTVFFRCCYFYTLVHNIVSMYLVPTCLCAS